MYLTQVHVGMQTAARRRLLHNYDWHQAIWKAFSNGDADASERPFLFRVDPRPGQYRLLILSSKAPTSQAWGQWETKRIPERFLDYSCYRFSLRANPTMKKVIRDANGVRKKNGRRVPIRNVDALGEWMERKADQHGFALEQLHVIPDSSQPVTLRDRRTVHYAQVEFQGVLRVTHRDRFVESIEKGIGSAKGFGFGLLALQPVRNVEEGVCS